METMIEPDKPPNLPRNRPRTRAPSVSPLRWHTDHLCALTDSALAEGMPLSRRPVTTRLRCARTRYARAPATATVRPATARDSPALATATARASPSSRRESTARARMDRRKFPRLRRRAESPHARPAPQISPVPGRRWSVTRLTQPGLARLGKSSPRETATHDARTTSYAPPRASPNDTPRCA
jgi:hypothetical protein